MEWIFETVDQSIYSAHKNYITLCNDLEAGFGTPFMIDNLLQYSF